MGESPTLTIRIDEATKKRLEDEAKKSDQTVTEYVARAVKMRWEGACSTCGRDMGGVVVQPPGMSAAFSAWAGQQTSRPGRGEESPYVALVTNEPTGNRIYTGTFLKDNVHDSYVSLYLEMPKGRSRNTERIIIPVMRQYIVAWQSQDTAAALRDRLAGFLRYTDVALATFPQLAQERPR
jgi:hypothetical protein